MSRFVYTKEGETPKSWEFDPNKLLSPEAETIERNTGWTFGEWLDKLGAGSVLATHALLHVFLKRDIPPLQFNQVEFSMSEIDMELDDEDLTRAIEVLQLKENRTAAEQKALDDMILRQMAAGGPKEEAPEPTSAASGNPGSPPT